MARSVLVVGLAVAGVCVLAGAGWALVAAAVLVFALWPRQADGSVAAWAAGAARRAREVARWAASGPRRAVAAVSMAGGVTLIPAGLGVWISVGAGLAAAGAVLAGLSVLSGWNA